MAIKNLNIPQAEVIEDHPDEDVSVFTPLRHCH